MFLTEDNDFQVLVGLSSFLLPLTSNQGSRVKKGRISSCPIYSQKVEISMCFCLNIQFRVLISSFFLPVASNKGSNKGQMSFCQINLPKNYDFPVLIRLSSFLPLVSSNKGTFRVKFHFVRFTPTKFQFPCVFAKKLQFSSPNKDIEFPFTRSDK